MSDILRPGDWCDGHEIVRLVGRGGHAEVYEALDRSRVRRAIKVLATDPGLASKLQARFAQEGHAISRIDHANVIRYFGSGIHEDRIYLVLEFVDGQSLLQRMDRLNGFVPVEDIVRWLRDACRGMVEAHRHRVIHRDLKPSNILISHADAVKVIDFGVAKLQDCGLSTTSEQALGTALFMAPEHIGRNVPPDERTDVYSMGVILYQALAGVHPMGRAPRNLADVVLWQINEPPRPLRERAPEVSPSLEFLVHHALEKDPDRRHQTMLLLADALEAELRYERASLRKLAINILPTAERSLAPTTALPAMAPSPPITTAAREGPMWSAAPSTAPQSGPSGSGASRHAGREAVLPPTPSAVPDALRARWGSTGADATKVTGSGPGTAAAGTIPMPAIGGPPGTGIPSSAHDTARDAFPPSFGPATAGYRTEPRADGQPDVTRDAVVRPSPSASPSTLRTPGHPVGTIGGMGTGGIAVVPTGPHALSASPASARPFLGAATEILPAANGVTAPTVQGAVTPMTPGHYRAPRSPLAATLPMAEPTSLLAERGSSASPVEKAVGWPSRGPRALPVVTFGSLLLALGLLVGWLLGRVPTPGAAPAASGPAPVRASASAPPASSAAAPTPGSAAVAPQASARHAPTLPRSGHPRP